MEDKIQKQINELKDSRNKFFLLQKELRVCTGDRWTETEYNYRKAKENKDFALEILLDFIDEENKLKNGQVSD